VPGTRRPQAARLRRGVIRDQSRGVT
jgi:hypothetical protein